MEEAEHQARASYAQYKAREKRDAGRLPSRVDWRYVNGDVYTSPIKDQGGCGSCVAFGTSTAVEGSLRIQRQDPFLPIHCSEAHLFYGCAQQDGGNCQTGWYISSAFSCFEEGVTDASLYPYSAGDQPFLLPENWKLGYTQGRAQITGNISEAKEYLAAQGMIAGRFTVYDDFFWYTSGVYHRSPDASAVGGHCICIVGYDEAEQCWICQNSWGLGWGERGFFRIGYGECGIDAFFWLPQDISRPSEAGAPLTSRVNLAAASEADGRVRLWSVNRGYAWSSSMLSADINSNWTNWTTYWPQPLQPMPGIRAAQLAAAPGQDQRLQLWVLGGEGTLWSVQENTTAPATEWSAWQPPQPAPSGEQPLQVAVGQLSDGRRQIWLLMKTGALWSRWEQRTDSQLSWNSWSRFQAVPGERTVQLAIVPLSNGALLLLAVGANGKLQCCWKQNADASAPWTRWGDFTGVKDKKVVQVAVARLADKRPQIFAITDRGELYTRWKQRVAWDAPWTSWVAFQRPGAMPVQGLTAAVLSDHRAQLWASTPLSQDEYAIWTCRKGTTDPSSAWTQWVRMPFPTRTLEEPRAVAREEEARTRWIEEEEAAHPA